MNVVRFLLEYNSESTFIIYQYEYVARIHKKLLDKDVNEKEKPANIQVRKYLWEIRSHIFIILRNETFLNLQTSKICHNSKVLIVIDKNVPSYFATIIIPLANTNMFFSLVLVASKISSNEYKLILIKSW